MKSNTLKSIWIYPALGLLGAFLIATTANAVEFCVTTRDELKDALADAASNGEHDTIKIAAGYYTPGLHAFWYNAHVSGGDDRDLTLVGGWAESDGDPCGESSIENPSATVLDAEGEDRVMTLAIRANTNLNVRLLTFRNGYLSEQYSSGGGLSINFHEWEHSGRVVIERNLFLDNQADRGGGLFIPNFNAVGNARIGVVNNTFVGNHAGNSNAAADIGMNGGDAGLLGAGIYVTNNTVVDNTVEDPVTHFTAAFRLRANTPNVFVINNNMWGNDGGDLYVAGDFERYQLRNNNIAVRKGRSPTGEFDNISAEPEYVPCPAPCFGSEWVPTVDSPLIDAGIHPGNISPFWIMPVFDAAGNPRVAQGTVDIGAYENHDRFFADRFESSN